MVYKLAVGEHAHKIYPGFDKLPVIKNSGSMCSFIIIMELSAMKKNPVKCKAKFEEICWIPFWLRYLLGKLCHFQAYSPLAGRFYCSYWPLMAALLKY